MTDYNTDMDYELKTHYLGANLCLKFGSRPYASLLINGLERDSIHSESEHLRLKVSSTVQTDYEWHEYIEAIVIYDRDTITATLYASKQAIKQFSIDRERK